MTTSDNYSAPQQYTAEAQPGQHYGYNGQPMVAAPGYVRYAPPTGPIGTVRGTGVAILLCIVTLGIYPLYYYFVTHEEMKRHTGQGVGGGIALVLSIFAGVVSPFLLSSEVGSLYARRGQARPVSGATGLWATLGVLILVGPIVWFVKTNCALNAYWRSVGAP